MMHLLEKVLVIGASGLVGRALILELNLLESCKNIVVVLRKPCAEWQGIKKIEQIMLDDFLLFDRAQMKDYSHVFSCLGTTLKAAGSKEKFYAIDYKINMYFACLLQDQETHFLIVSSLGADIHARFFYYRVKGKLEQDLQSLALMKLSIFRPSLLLGQRQQDVRFLEDVGQKIYQKVKTCFPKVFFAYAPVSAEQVAHTMVEAALKQTEKCEIYANLQIQKH